ncbi:MULTISPECIES: DUF5815 family protein [unclassified Haladaptatus]|uniref:DUF5815 family protein n=1 Tax=unclassified Haladaptatus TaxID=2622732 RepID=UPI0023E7EE2B|nr:MULTISPECIES: DUF5815 family protein [unclassified Haladaptatus]
MSEPRVPGSRDASLTLACGESVDVRQFDMGMREFTCDCGEVHAIVMDVHPLGRFVPEFLEAVLQETIDTASGAEFGTLHMMGIVKEEFPKKVVSKDVSNDGQLGCSMLWVSHFDDRRLHEIVVELIIELMEHAVSHAEDDSAMSEFEEQMLSFDVAEFVEEYRSQRDFHSATDQPV